MTALAIAISAMPPVMALRSPTRAATAEAERASASSAALSGSSEAPASAFLGGLFKGPQGRSTPPGASKNYANLPV
jgi:hypothetical protein